MVFRASVSGNTNSTKIGQRYLGGHQRPVSLKPSSVAVAGVAGSWKRLMLLLLVDHTGY